MAVLQEIGGIKEEAGVVSEQPSSTRIGGDVNTSLTKPQPGMGIPFRICDLMSIQVKRLIKGDIRLNKSKIRTKAEKTAISPQSWKLIQSDMT